MASEINLSSPQPLASAVCCPFYGGDFAAVYSLFIVTPIVCGSCVFGHSIMQYFVSFLVMGSSRWGRERYLLYLFLSSGCFVAIAVLCLFLKVHWVVMWCVIVAIPVTPTCFFILLHFP